MKGKLWSGVREFASVVVPGGVSSVVAHLDEPELSDFFIQRFLAASWYDALPIVPITSAIASSMGVTRGVYLERAAIWQAKQDLRGVYRFMLTRSSPESVLRGYPKVHSQLYAFGDVTVTRVEPYQAECQVTGIPAWIVPWWKPATRHYLCTVLEEVGAVHPQMAFMGTEPDGEKSGVPLIRSTCIATWSRAQGKESTS